MGCGVRPEDGSEHPLAVLYSAVGCDVNLAPVRDLGLTLDGEGYVVTDACQQTSVPGIYAAGDVVSDINQISVAFGQAAVAAVRIHNVLDDVTLCRRGAAASNGLARDAGRGRAGGVSGALLPDGRGDGRRPGLPV